MIIQTFSSQFEMFINQKETRYASFDTKSQKITSVSL
jgi:hypothetical protein